MKCNGCKNDILHKSGNVIKLRTDGPIIFENGICKARCYWCKRDIEIPIEIKDGTKIGETRFVARVKNRRIIRS